MRHFKFRRALISVSIISTFAGPAMAADGFKVRFPLSGTLGGEIVAQIENPGFFASVSLTQIEIDKITDNTGNAFQQVKSGAFATPAPIAGAVRRATYSGSIDIDLKQSQTNANLVLGYQTEKNYGGGHLVLALNLPYTTRLSRQSTYSGSTPTLSPLTPALTSPPLPPGTAAAAQAGAQAGFNTAYRAQLNSLSNAGTGAIEGAGDAEVTGAWVYRKDDLKFVTGLTLVVPSGKYDAASQLNIGFGDFYTLRPGFAVAYNPSTNWTLGARGSLAFNTRNQENQIKSGDYSALDLAAAYRSPIGVFGPHVLLIKQFSDDNGGTLGANRFSSTGAGLFFTTLIPTLEAAVNLSCMTTLNSRNALSGSFYQVRVSKAF
jgi:hypothetical protein